MATFYVTDTDDSGVLSLHDAIIQANTLDGDDTIDLSQVSGTITINSLLPKITSNINFVGNGDDTISGDHKYRVFWVDSGTVSFSNLNIINGYAKGGNGGNPGGGGGAGLGGGLFINNGTVTVDGVTFSGNQAVGGNGGRDGGSSSSNPILPREFNSISSADIEGIGGSITFPLGEFDINGGFGGGGGGGGNSTTDLVGVGGGGGGIGGDGSDPILGKGGGGIGGGDGYISSGGLSDNGVRGVLIVDDKGGTGGFGGGGGGGGFSAGGSGVSKGFGDGTGGFGGGGGGSFSDFFRIRGGSFGGDGGTGGFGGTSNSIFSYIGGGGGGAGGGGAIFINTGNLTLTNTSFENNSATGGIGGIGFDTRTSGTNGQGKGGAIFINTDATVILNGQPTQVFTGNSASDALFTADGNNFDNNDVYGIIAINDALVTIDNTVSDLLVFENDIVVQGTSPLSLDLRGLIETDIMTLSDDTLATLSGANTIALASNPFTFI